MRFIGEPKPDAAKIGGSVILSTTSRPRSRASSRCHPTTAKLIHFRFAAPAL